MTPTKTPQRVLLLVNADCSDTNLHSPQGARGPRRRTDFETLASALDADVLDWSAVRSSWLGRTLEHRTNWYVAAAVLAYWRSPRYRLIWCMSEQEGTLLALLLKLTRRTKALMMVCVVPTSRPMWFMLRILKVQSHITRIFTTSTFALDTLRSSWRIPATTLSVLPYQVDVDFFNDSWADEEREYSNYILAVGRQSRDYETLIEAVRELPINLVIAADSNWARAGKEMWRDQLPDNVFVTSRDYPSLRNLYAGSTFVVVPLQESDVQNGITSIGEAMAMGKAVVVSRTRGQSDLVADDQVIQRDGSGRATSGYFARYYAPEMVDLHGPTGIYVAVGDIDAMRAAIERLLDNHTFAKELGDRGRSVCEAIVSLECFVDRVLAATQDFR